MSQQTQEKFKNIIVTNTIICFVFLGLLCSINAVAVEGYQISVVDYGIYEASFVKYGNAPDTDVGKIEKVSTKQLLRLTDRIPGKKGTKFGIRYILDGAQQGKDVEVLVKVMHSGTVNEQPTTIINEWSTTKKIGEIAFDGWKFNTDSKLVHGNWTIQLYHEGMKLAEKSFQVF
jgi:hypothetical protein